jgi:hypothetical protein
VAADVLKDCSIIRRVRQSRSLLSFETLGTDEQQHTVILHKTFMVNGTYIVFAILFILK